VLGNEVDTDAGLVEGGRATGVVELGGVPPAAQQTAFAIMLNILKVVTTLKQGGKW
jgi:hypothetical protein